MIVVIVVVYPYNNSVNDNNYVVVEELWQDAYFKDYFVTSSSSEWCILIRCRSASLQKGKRREGIGTKMDVRGGAAFADGKRVLSEGTQI